jgi:hypothetical protein
VAVFVNGLCFYTLTRTLPTDASTNTSLTGKRHDTKPVRITSVKTSDHPPASAPCLFWDQGS